VTSPESVAAEIVRERDGHHLLLLCDFDGTLCEFRPDPTAVYLDDDRRALLAALAACDGCTVGVVSGRRLADVRSRVGDIGTAYFAGFHGLEITGTDEESFLHPDASGAVEAMQAIARRIAPDVRRLSGVFIEDKGLSIAIHYRDAEPAQQVVAQSIFVDAARPEIDAGRLRLLPGSYVVELLPQTSWNKGGAVRWIRERVAARHGAAFTVYIGDDVTDEDAFTAVREGAGLAVAASTRVTGGQRLLDGPPEVARLLAALSGALNCGDG
jgi:trehalose-phosphatase